MNKPNQRFSNRYPKKDKPPPRTTTTDGVLRPVTSEVTTSDIEVLRHSLKISLALKGEENRRLLSYANAVDDTFTLLYMAVDENPRLIDLQSCFQVRVVKTFLEQAMRRYDDGLLPPDYATRQQLAEMMVGTVQKFVTERTGAQPRGEGVGGRG